MLDYSIKSITENGALQMGFDPETAYYWYGCTVTNLGSDGVFLNLDGGGNNELMGTVKMNLVIGATGRIAGVAPFRSGNLVSNSLPSDLAFELGKR